jgi:two-component sensor histidine kinase
LQIIISLLRLQKEDLISDEAKTHFNEAINRIMVMSLIHKKLYQEKELAHISIESYLTELATDINSISNLGFPVNFNVSSKIDQVGLKTIVPLGLLVNELISNSVKHAFTKMEKGTINIEIKNFNANSFKLIYNDDGTWVEPNKENPSFGLELISILTSQLEGECSKIDSEFIFTLKNLDN